MSTITGDDENDDVAEQANAVIESVKECVDRGEGLKPCHVYVDGSGRCQCGMGPILTERRMG
jgi:hypothetical protein